MRLMTIALFLTHIVCAQMTLPEKARSLQRDLIEKHLVDGLYVSIVPAGAKVDHTVDEPGNVIHAGVWTGRYLAGVGYQYAATKDPKSDGQKEEKSGGKNDGND